MTGPVHCRSTTASPLLPVRGPRGIPTVALGCRGSSQGSVGGRSRHGSGACRAVCTVPVTRGEVERTRWWVGRKLCRGSRRGGWFPAPPSLVEFSTGGARITLPKFGVRKRDEHCQTPRFSYRVRDGICLTSSAISGERTWRPSSRSTRTVRVSSGPRGSPRRLDHSPHGCWLCSLCRSPPGWSLRRLPSLTLTAVRLGVTANLTAVR